MSTDSPDWVKANQGKAKTAFKQAQASLDQKPQKSQEQQGSPMVKKHKLGLQPSPSGSLKNASHAQTYNQNLAKEKINSNQKMKAALVKSKAAQIRKSPEKQVELEKGKNKEKDGRER